MHYFHHVHNSTHQILHTPQERERERERERGYLNNSYKNKICSFGWTYTHRENLPMHFLISWLSKDHKLRQRVLLKLWIYSPIETGLVTNVCCQQLHLLLGSSSWNLILANYISIITSASAMVVNLPRERKSKFVFFGK